MQKLLVPSQSTPHPGADAGHWMSQHSQRCLCYSQVHWAKGEALMGGAEGLHPLWTPPCTLPYLFPLARNLLCFSSANPLRLYMCRYRHPPMGGGEGTRPCLLHLFYLGTIPDKSLLLFSFSLLAFLTAFFHTCSLCSLKPSSSGSLLESTRI